MKHAHEVIVLAAGRAERLVSVPGELRYEGHFSLRHHFARIREFRVWAALQGKAQGGIEFDSELQAKLFDIVIRVDSENEPVRRVREAVQRFQADESGLRPLPTPTERLNALWSIAVQRFEAHIPKYIWGSFGSLYGQRPEGGAYPRSSTNSDAPVLGWVTATFPEAWFREFRGRVQAASVRPEQTGRHAHTWPDVLLLRRRRARALGIDKKGKLWVGTFQARHRHAVIIDAEPGTWTSLFTDPP